MTDNITLHHLRQFRAEIGADIESLRTELKKCAKDMGRLADGMLALGREMKAVTATAETLAVASTAHAQRLARIEQHLGISDANDQT